MAGGLKGGGGQSVDSLEHRDKLEDSISLYYLLPNSTQTFKLDSSVTDFTRRFPIPAHHVFLGNTGNATRSILFAPKLQSGWDPGFHAFDVYRFRPEAVRFYNTTRPFTELAYLLGGKAEQIIEITHTQNIRPNWNASFQYRLINSPGYFKNQGTNHNNYLLTSWYQSVNKRYNNYFVLVANSLDSDENGGIKNDQDYLSDPLYKERFNIPTNIGGDVEFQSNSKLNTGHKYNDFNLIVTQQYDLGKKDSLVSDSTVIPLFYPRLRFEHTFKFGKYKYLFKDNVPDSVYYNNVFNIPVHNIYDTVIIRERWKEIVNDFSIYQYPDAKNLLQFIKVGVALQNLKGEFTTATQSFFNLALHGEYRNKTRDKKWDVFALGALYLSGLNSGDYHAEFVLKRFVGKKQTYVDFEFRNVNRTPSFIFDSRSSFYNDVPKTFKKENISNLTASFYHPGTNLKVTGNYFLVSNYSYFKDYYKVEQQEPLFNLFIVAIEKKFKMGKGWVWYSDVFLQKETGSAPVNVPLLFTRNRIGYEGNLGFKNLNISMGFEVNYHLPYKADGYSSPSGQFFYQDSTTIKNRLFVASYLHFRIRSLRTFIRAENLNSFTIRDGMGLSVHNYSAPDYPYPGFNLRLGILWSFVN
jgi:Putative porin